MSIIVKWMQLEIIVLIKTLLETKALNESLNSS